MPGTYWLKAVYGKFRDSVSIQVQDDPRLDIPAAERQAKTEALRGFYNQVDQLRKGYERLTAAEKTIKLVESQFVNVPDSLKKEVLQAGKTLQDSIGVLKDAFITQKEGKGIQRNPNTLNAVCYRAIEYIESGRGAPNASARIAIQAAQKAADAVLARVEALFQGPWKEYRKKAEAVQYSLFKE